MITTNVFKKNILAFRSGVRRIVNHGGTSSSKTWSVLQLLLLIAQRRQGVVISVMSETLPHLKLGAIRDFNKILVAEGLYNEREINKSDRVYHFGNSIIEFFSADSPSKVTGSRRNILYINECNNISYDIIKEAEIRTEDNIFYDYNPTSDFWITEEVFTMAGGVYGSKFKGMPEYVLIKSNYKDNRMCPPSIVREIELRAKRDPNFKRVHIDLEFGVSEGLIFPSFTMVDDMPATDRQRYGMDFGFTNDPSTLIDERINDGKLWLDEMYYERGMTNPQLAKVLKDLVGKARVVADSSEPKSIKEISEYGINIVGAEKGPDSVRAGIDKLKGFEGIMVTKRSVNMIKEFRNYKYKQNSDGKFTNEPIDYFNHCIDPARYAITDLTQPAARPMAAHFSGRR